MLWTPVGRVVDLVSDGTASEPLVLTSSATGSAVVMTSERDRERGLPASLEPLLIRACFKLLNCPTTAWCCGKSED